MASEIDPVSWALRRCSVAGTTAWNFAKIQRVDTDLVRRSGLRSLLSRYSTQVDVFNERFDDVVSRF